MKLQIIEMLEFGKMYCNLHPHQLITNFCNKEQCFVGLCANCICIHTQNHIEKGTIPDYQNIRVTYKKVQDKIKTQLQLFDKDKQRVDNITSVALEKRAKVKQTIQTVKQKVSYLLGDYFYEKQKNMLRQIESQQKKYGLHCQNRLSGIKSYISRQISNLTCSAQQLSSKNFLQSLPRIHSQNLVNSEKLHYQISQQLTKNQNFSTEISINQQALSQLISVLNKSITVKNNTQNLFNSKNQKQSKILSRPSSQGKLNHKSPLENTGSLRMNSTMKQRNTESQVYFYKKNSDSNQTNFYPQTLFKNSIDDEVIQPRRQNRSSIMSNQQFYNSQQNLMKSPQQLQPKLVQCQMNNRAPLINYIPSPHNCYPNYLISHQTQQKPIATQFIRNQNAIYPQFRPFFNHNITQNAKESKTSRNLQKSSVAGMNKKNKRSGLKIYTQNSKTQPNSNSTQNLHSNNQK